MPDLQDGESVETFVAPSAGVGWLGTGRNGPVAVRAPNTHVSVYTGALHSTMSGHAKRGLFGFECRSTCRMNRGVPLVTK